MQLEQLSLDISLANIIYHSPPQFLPGHQKLTERMRKRLYYGLDKDLTLDSLSGPVTGEVYCILYKSFSKLQSSTHL